jgi:hypothetical protein
MAILRRSCLAFVLLAASMAAVPVEPVPVKAEPPGISIQNDRYLIEVSAASGAITRIQDKPTGLELIREPLLADNWKFTLPLPGKAAWQATEANYILGKDQRLTAHEAAGAKLVLEWAGPLTSVLGKPHDVSAIMTIHLGEDIQFTFTIKNGTDLEIGEVFYPVLGGTLGLGETPDARKKTELVLPGAAALQRASIFHTFENFSWLGVIGPEQFYSYPDKLSMPWMELSQPALKRSVYFGSHDPVARYKVVHLEMSPGVSGQRAEGNWPRPDELAGLPAGVKMCFVHFPYQPAGRDFEAAPVVLRFHDGDWREGSRIYRHWLASQGGLDEPRGDWSYRTPAFQECGPVPFKDLPEWARRGAAAGVGALLLTQWKAGGADDGVPGFELDPGLGSREDLAEALRQCHAAGVKVSLLVDLQPVSPSSDAYARQLREYTCKDRWGIPPTVLGWLKGSPVTGGYGAGERRVTLNPGHPGMRELLVWRLKVLAELGIDGVHLQSFFACPLDFNSGTGRTADRATWEGGIECMKDILRTCRTVRPGFCISTDSLWDRVLAVTQVGSAEVRDGCPLREAFGSWQPTFTATGPSSMPAVNDALLYRGRLRIAPADGRPMGGESMEGLAGYLRAVLGVREALALTLQGGERTGPQAIRGEGSTARGVFRDPVSGLRTAVLVNREHETVEDEVAGFMEPGPATVLLWQPQQGVQQASWPTRVRIPAHQLCAITEEPAADRLAGIARWEPPVRDEKTIFDFASPEDLRDWKLEGQAFSVASIGLIRPATLNSLARAGEPATGAALSPPFTVEPRFDHMEIVFHGGWSQKDGGQETLAIQLIDASSGAVLEQITPPGTHELTVLAVKLDNLRGKSIRLRMVDKNTDSSYAWIGLQRLSLVGPKLR